MTWKVDGLAEDRPHDDVSALPAEARLDGLPVYPRFAAEDFERAFLRYCILVGAEEAFGDDQESQLERDRTEFPDIALYGEQTGHFVMPEANALDFVRLFVRTSARAYAEALRYAARVDVGGIQT